MDKGIHIVATVKDGGHLEQAFEDWRRLGRICTRYGGMLDWKPLTAVCAGEQDLVLAGASRHDETLVERLRGSGQIIARFERFSQATYEGRALADIGYSLDVREDVLPAILGSERFMRGLVSRNAHDMQMGLLGLDAHPTSYLWDCCTAYHLSKAKK